MSNEEYPYPEDEFDALGARRVPQGVHREPPPRWRSWLPYVLVLVLVPLLTFGAVKFFAGDPASDPEPTATESVDSTTEDPGDGDEAEPADTDSPTGEEPGDEPGGDDTDGETGDGEPGEEEPGEGSDDPGAELDYATSVLVLNGAGIQGLAGEVADALEGEGWTNTEADNYSADTPLETALYYTSEEFVAEAQAVADALGITNLIESETGASNGVVIVIRTDFSMPSDDPVPVGQPAPAHQ